MLKALFILEIFFDPVGKQPDKKAKVNFKVYDVTEWAANNVGNNVGKWLDKKAKVNFKIYDFSEWTANNCNIHIA